MQLVIVIIILICAIAYTAFRIYRVLTNKSGKCYGCPLKDACDKNGSKRKSC